MFYQPLQAVKATSSSLATGRGLSGCPLIFRDLLSLTVSVLFTLDDIGMSIWA
jgi:hypothetical protein